MDYTVHGILQAWILEWAAFTFSRGSSQFRDRTQSSTLQVDSIPAEPQGKPKNTGVGSISFLQLIFLTRGINPGSLALQANSLPVELSGKPNGHLRCRVNGLAPPHLFHFSTVPLIAQSLLPRQEWAQAQTWHQTRSPTGHVFSLVRSSFFLRGAGGVVHWWREAQGCLFPSLASLFGSLPAVLLESSIF